MSSSTKPFHFFNKTNNDHVVENDPIADPITEGYLKYTHRKVLFLLAMFACLLILIIFTLGLGGSGLNYLQILDLLFHPDGTWNSTVIWDLRLPRIAAAILAGCALGISGAVMQGILRNPLASPFTLGLSNASAFGAALGILVLNSSIIVGSTAAQPLINSPAIVTICAFLFAMLATALIIILSKVTSASPESLVLAGMAISAIFSAALAFTQYIADDVALSSIVFWQFGSFDKVGWSDLRIIFIVSLIGIIYFLCKMWDYNAMEAGEEVARGLGMNIARTRLVGLTVSAIITAVTVSYMGVIGFIGLAAPHIVKRVIGNDNRYLLIGSMLVGSIILLVANILSHYAFGGKVIPVGIITSAIGGPLFLYVLIRGYKKDASC